MVSERLDIIVNERGGKAVRKNIASIGSQAVKTQKTVGRSAVVIRKDVNKIGEEAKNTTSAIGGMRTAFIALGGLLALREFVRLSDDLTNVQNRLRLVTTGTENLTAVTRELFNISNRTRSSFRSTAELYARTALATKELGLTQKQTLEFTESLNQAVILSGASAQEASAGIIQLSQGLASGTLRGDELRSVLEQLPAVADVISASLGVTRGELRKLGEEGKITAETIITAFAEAKTSLAEDFASTVPTVGQAFVVLKNNVTEALGDFNEATGLTENLAGAIIVLGDNVDVLSKVFLTAAIPLATYFTLLKVQSIVTATGAVAALTVTTAVQGPVVTTLAARWAVLNAVVARNPFIFAAVAVATITSAIVVWGSEADETTKKIGDLEDATRKLALVEIPRDSPLGLAVPTAGNIPALPEVDVSDRALSRALDEDARALEQFEDRVEKASITLNGAIERNLISLKKEADLIRLTTRERAVEVRVTKELAKLKGVLRRDLPGVTDAIREQVIFNQNLRDQDAALQAIEKPVEVYNAKLKALIALTNAGAISQERFIREIEKTALVRNLLDTVQDISGTPESGRIIALERERDQRKTILEDAQNAELISRRQFNLQIKLNDQKFATESSLLFVEREAILKRLNGPQEKVNNQLASLNSLMDEGKISAAQYAVALRDINRANVALENSIGSLDAELTGDPFAMELEALKQHQENRLAIIDKGVAAGVLSVEEGERRKTLAVQKHADEQLEVESKKNQLIASSTGDLLSSLASAARLLAEQRGSDGKKEFRAAKALATATAIINTGLAVTGTLKNEKLLAAYPANIIAAAAIGVQGAVQIAIIQGQQFQDGGFVTGPGGPRDDLISAQLSNGEFVVNARATEENRGLLEAINSGNRQSGQRSSFNPGPSGANVNIVVNNLSGNEVDVQTTETTGGGLDIEVVVSKVSDRLASDFTNGQGSLTKVIKNSQKRKF